MWSRCSTACVKSCCVFRTSLWVQPNLFATIHACNVEKTRQVRLYTHPRLLICKAQAAYRTTWESYQCKYAQLHWSWYEVWGPMFLKLKLLQKSFLHSVALFVRQCVTLNTNTSDHVYTSTCTALNCLLKGCIQHALPNKNVSAMTALYACSNYSHVSIPQSGVVY